MPVRPKTNLNHPIKGSTTKVEPIKSVQDIQQIKVALKHEPRDLCMFVMGINTAFRAGELLSLKVAQVKHLKAGKGLWVKQSKTKKYRAVTLNVAVIEALDYWLRCHPRRQDKTAPLFPSRKGWNALTVPSLHRLVKKWCREAGLEGNYGSHSLRKTWGYHQRIGNNAPIPLLMSAYGHMTQKQTLDYLCIQDDEIEKLYMDLVL